MPAIRVHPWTSSMTGVCCRYPLSHSSSTRPSIAQILSGHERNAFGTGESRASVLGDCVTCTLQMHVQMQNGGMDGPAGRSIP